MKIYQLALAVLVCTVTCDDLQSKALSEYFGQFCDSQLVSDSCF